LTAPLHDHITIAAELKKIDIKEKGVGNISFYPGSLRKGVYRIAVAAGKLVGTKKMVH